MSTPKTVGALTESLERALERPPRPEDVDATTKLFSPIENAVAVLPTLPDVPDDAAGRIVKLLWWKRHPAEVDYGEVAGMLQDESPLVRLNGAETLRVALETAPGPDAPPLTPLKETVTSVARCESSPMLAGQLTELKARLEDLAKPRRRKRAKVSVNPYIAGPPVRSTRSFFGRDDILAQIKTHVSSGGAVRAVVLHGARRSGKTSLLYRIAAGALGPGAVPAYVDMQSVAGSPLSVLLRTLLRAVWEALDAPENHLPSHDPDFSEVREYLAVALHDVGPRSLVLMFDEYEVLEHFLSSGLGAQLQSLLETSPTLFMIFAGSRKLEAMPDDAFAPLLDMTRYLKITFLERDDALRLVTEPSAGALEFIDGAAERLVGLTSGHPFYTQLLCQGVFEVAGGGGVVRPAHVDEAVRRFLRNPAPHLVLSWNALRAVEAAVGSALAAMVPEDAAAVEPADIAARLREEGFPLKIGVASVQRTLTALANADWVAKEKERNAYRFTMELVRRWIAEERPVSALTEAQQTEIASKTASFWQQRRAWTVDALTLILLFLLGFLPLALVTGPGTAAVFGLLCPFVVLFGPLRFGCGTLGMRIFRLQVTPAPGHALDTKSTATLAALYMLRATSTLMVIALVAALFDQGAEPAVSVFGGVAAILETLDHVMIWRGEKRQGLWDKLGGVLVIPAEVVRS